MVSIQDPGIIIRNWYDSSVFQSGLWSRACQLCDLSPITAPLWTCFPIELWKLPKIIQVKWMVPLGCVTHAILSSKHHYSLLLILYLKKTVISIKLKLYEFLFCSLGGVTIHLFCTQEYSSRSCLLLQTVVIVHGGSLQWQLHSFSQQSDTP